MTLQVKTEAQSYDQTACKPTARFVDDQTACKTTGRIVDDPTSCKPTGSFVDHSMQAY